MIEILYRIYEVADAETAQLNINNNREFGIYNSTSKEQNIELLMDCMVVESREQFKEIIRDTWGKDIAFAYRRNKLKAGDYYCIIIGEHCYNTERHFNKITFTCDYCGANITTYINHPINISDSTIKYDLFSLYDEYKNKRFCSCECMHNFVEKEKQKIAPNEEKEFWIEKNMFATNGVLGYIYKISKKSSGEFYIGQTIYAPIFRWGQHLKTARFPIENIMDYQFEVVEIIPAGGNILEREKYWIQKMYLENPSKSLNISCTTNLDVVDAKGV